jgi:hypothetical protein
MMILCPSGFGHKVLWWLNLCVPLRSQNCELAAAGCEDCLAANKKVTILMTISYFNLQDSADVSIVGLCCRRRRGVQATTRPPCPRAAPVPMRRLPLGCSASDCEALLADASGLLYNYARQGKVNDIRFILDVWSQWRLHLVCANGHAGIVRLLLSRGTANVMSNGSRNPRLDEFKVEDNERTKGRHDERAVRQEAMQQPAGARRQESGGVRGQREGGATRGNATTSR